jgi:hypothetical protein
MNMDMIQQMIDLLLESKIDSDKFFKGNNAAGVRLRAKMQKVKNIAQTIRVSVLAENATLKK